MIIGDRVPRKGGKEAKFAKIVKEQDDGRSSLLIFRVASGGGVTIHDFQKYLLEMCQRGNKLPTILSGTQEVRRRTK